MSKTKAQQVEIKRLAFLIASDELQKCLKDQELHITVRMRLNPIRSRLEQTGAALYEAYKVGDMDPGETSEGFKALCDRVFSLINQYAPRRAAKLAELASDDPSAMLKRSEYAKWRRGIE